MARRRSRTRLSSPGRNSSSPRVRRGNSIFEQDKRARASSQCRWQAGRLRNSELPFRRAGELLYYWLLHVGQVGTYLKGKTMLHWFKQLDRILRGEATRLSALRAGTIDLSAGGLLIVLIILRLLYGLCMGLFSVIATGGRTYAHQAATTVQVPPLYSLLLL